MPRRRPYNHSTALERRERMDRAWKSLSGSCAGDYLTATTVKEKPRRQTTGSRLRVVIGHDDRGPRPLVCAHGPLNDFQANALGVRIAQSHCTCVSTQCDQRRLTCRNDEPGASASRRYLELRGTSGWRAAFR